MKKSTLLLLTAMAIPALAISQTTVNPTAAQAPAEPKPVLPGDPVPLPVAPSVPVPTVPPAPLPAIPPVVPPAPLPVVPTVPVPPALAPLEEKAKPGEVVPVPPPMPEPTVRGQGKGKGRPEDKDKDDHKKPAPAASVRPVPIPDHKPAPDATPPVPEDKMKRPPVLPVDDTGKVTPPAVPGSVTPAPTPGKRPGFPETRPMPAQPSGTPAPEVISPPMRTDDPKDSAPRVRPERPLAQMPPSKEMAKVLEDQGKRDRKADAQQAEKIEDKNDAKRLLMTILGGAVGVGANDPRPNPPRPGDRPSDRPSDRPGDRGDDRFGDRFRQGYRPSFEEVGRTQQDRERNVGLMVQRFQGRAPQLPPPNSPRRDPRSFETSQTQRHTQFYEGNRRVVRYSSMQEIPPVIVASQRLNRVQVNLLSQSGYTGRPQGAPQGQYYNEVPQSYTAGDAYAVSYGVDPDSAISTNDILFRQGSTDFADAYSYDLVIDVAEAMNAPALLQETFVIEGHASAEGDYGQNLLLSQERAERISRELVRYGMSAERLMPVGYGETEAAHPANAGDSERRLDRRVMVFRMR
jgi:outer membrane protein OmpA-like peptidoglycan-associated protein